MEKSPQNSMTIISKWGSVLVLIGFVFLSWRCTVDSSMKKEVEGNYELNLTITEAERSTGVKVYFSSNKDLSTRTYLEVAGNGYKVIRESEGQTDVWKTYEGIGNLPWEIYLLKKGNFFRYSVNNITGYIRGPMGEWQGKYDPWKAYVGLEAPEDVVIESFTVTTLPWLSHASEPIITIGPKGSFYEKQIIPGAILNYKGTYYMYVMAGMEGNEEGSSRRTIGVATSKDLENWKVHPEPLITYEDYPYDNLYVNGVVETPEGKIAIMFAAQVFPEWKGFMLATADNPFGPFEPYADNPAFKHYTHAHEFDLIRVDHPDYRYILFYSGFTTEPKSGPVGDRGYVLYSDDLKHWTEHPQNPVFSPQTLDNWDAVHIRPRSLNKIGDVWYVWYEGCNQWTPPGTELHGWWDTVGLARSKDLVNWEYYPRNPALPGLGISAEQFDNRWVGWPRMVVKDDIGYVFYTGNARVGLRKIPLNQLTNWNSEGGKIIDLLAGK